MKHQTLFIGLLVLLCLLFCVTESLVLRDPKLIKKMRPKMFGQVVEKLMGQCRVYDTDNANYKTFYYETLVDKFGFSTAETFLMRYLVNDTFWGGKDSPIFFYAGNEGDITTFAENTGVMFELAQQVGAMLVFAEHRYYGTSKINNNTNLNYLSAELALADYAEFLNWFKSEGYPGTNQSAVIVFGGSYGGMLAAWMTMKYPFSILGAWAASAPVAWFGNLTDCNAYCFKVTKDFAQANENCPENILRSWDVIDDLGKTESGRDQLSKVFNLCSPLKTRDDVYSLIGEINGAWSNVAMVNYPYPTEFLQPLPAWPVNVICDKLSSNNLTNDELMVQIAAAVEVFYNYLGTDPCFNISEGEIGLNDNIWEFQACTEMIYPMCSRKGWSMFPFYDWDWEAERKSCQQQWGDVAFKPHWAITQFGGRDILRASNLILSNGKLDPWAAGGIFDNDDNPRIYPLVIEHGAHHLDLRSSNDADPETVKEIRAAEFLIVKSWLKNYYKKLYKLE